jgi:hypothetical protein
VPLKSDLVLYGISYLRPPMNSIGVTIYDPQAHSFKYVENGVDIDNFYVVLVAASEPFFGIPN